LESPKLYKQYHEYDSMCPSSCKECLKISNRNPQFDPATLRYNHGYYDGFNELPHEKEFTHEYDEGYLDGEGDRIAEHEKSMPKPLDDPLAELDS